MANKAFTLAKEEWEDARQALNSGELQVALRLAEQFTQQYPRVCSGWTLLGRIHRRLNQPDEALDSFRRSLDFASPKRHPMILANIGTLLRDLGALGDAESTYREAIHLLPDEAGLHILLGGTLARQGRYDEAKAAHRKAVDLGNGDTDEAYLNLAYILRREGHNQLALEMVEKALEIDPAHGPTTDLHRELLALSELNQ